MTDTTTLPTQEIQRLLQMALNGLNSNDVTSAEGALQQVLKLEAEEPDALQLLGLIRRAQGQIAEAEALYRRSLAARPEQPHVLRNLGKLLDTQGRAEEAKTCLEEAVRLQPNFAEAHLDLGHVLHGLEDFAAAERCYRRTLHLQPNFLLAKQSLSGLLNDMGRADEAERLIKQVLAAGVQDKRQLAAFHQNMGVAVKLQNRLPEALQWFDSAQTLVPEIPLVDLNRASTLHKLGRNEEALEFYRRAIARNPLDIVAHRDLNFLLYQMGRDEEFTRSYDETAVFYPEASGLHLAKANLLFKAGQFERAEESYRVAISMEPGVVYCHDGLALSLAAQGKYDDAITEHQRALKYDATVGLAWANFADTLLHAGDAKEALKAADKALDAAPDDQRVLAIWGLALRALNDPRDEVLNDYENFVQIFDIEVPPGHDDVDAFNRDLSIYLASLHHDQRHPVDQTVRGGTQTTDHIFGRGHQLVDQLRTRIDAAVKTYIANMKDDAEHPLHRRRRRNYLYSGSWSTKLHDCGFHTNHVHMEGWISSAYYAHVPDAVLDEDKKEGWLKFGEPNFDAHIKDPVRRLIKPKAGRLVLFPSYMWHGTVPFQSAEERITIAFDAVPRR